MDKPKSYCEAVEKYDLSNLHRIYHDQFYGFPILNDDELFGRLILEIFQAGLSWTTILNKQRNFEVAFDGFNIQKIATYREADRERLLADPGIIRNRLKIDATIHNANVVLQLQQEFGSFKNWLDHFHPATLQEWVSHFKKRFKFTGGEIVNEFLMSTGYIPGAHLESCPVFSQIIQSEPPWVIK